MIEFDQDDHDLIIDVSTRSSTVMALSTAIRDCIRLAIKEKKGVMVRSEFGMVEIISQEFATSVSKK